MTTEGDKHANLRDSIGWFAWVGFHRLVDQVLGEFVVAQNVPGVIPICGHYAGVRVGV